jgi:hypothetical protein
VPGLLPSVLSRTARSSFLVLLSQSAVWPLASATGSCLRFHPCPISILQADCCACHQDFDSSAARYLAFSCSVLASRSSPLRSCFYEVFWRRFLIVLHVDYCREEAGLVLSYRIKSSRFFGFYCSQTVVSRTRPQVVR